MPVTLNGSGQVIVQIQSVTKVDAFTSSSTSMVDITGLSVNITPTNSSNKVLIIASFVLSGDSWSTGGSSINLVRNSTNIAIGTSGSSINATTGYNAWSANQVDTTGNFTSMVITFVDSPSTTSSTTYKLQGRTNAGGGSFAINRRLFPGDPLGYSATITVMEISG